MKNEDTEKINNAGNPLYLLFIFIVIIGFIFFIPEVYEKYNKDKASLYGIGSKNETSETKKEEKPTSKLSDYFRKEDSIRFENLAFLNLRIDGNTLYIDVNNDTTKTVDMKTKNYYIEFYRTENNQRSFVNRRFLKSEEVINPQSNITLSVDISGITIDENVSFAIARVDDEAAPAVTLENNTLTCMKANNIYVYSFEEETLVKTEYRVTQNKDETTLNSYKEKAKTFNNLNGVTAKIEEADTTFTFSSTFDYKVISKYKVDIDNLYNANSKANAIAFKMGAEGFDCK